MHLRRRLLAVPLFLALAGLLPAVSSARPLPTYRVGVAAESIAPGADGKWQGQPVYLGGFGIGGGTQFLSGRAATGVLGGGPMVRAIAIGDGKQTFAIADIEVQGWFGATRDGALGLEDIRHAVAAQLGGALPASHVVIQSDHTHGGADAMGVWGGVPDSFRQYMFDQTVKAIVEAYRSMQPGTLWYGTANAHDLINNQFSYDQANQAMDDDLRLLQAKDKHGHVFATMLNLSSHADVLGSSNTLITGDWPQAVNPLLEQRFGGKAMTVVGTLGRSQPNRPGCGTPGLSGGAAAMCELDAYADEVVDRAQQAADSAQPLTGSPVVDAESFLITDPSSSAFLLGISYAGRGEDGFPMNRSMQPPWLTGNVLGTSTATARIGDVLLSAGPGEMYPQIPLKVRDVMQQQDRHIRGWMTAGLADDQLGYLIAPFEAYPQPVIATFFDHDALNGDTIVRCAQSQGGDCRNPIDPIGNDNYAFNVSHTMGERVTCSLLRGAGELFGVGEAARDAYSRCAAFPNDAVLPADEDVALPSAPIVPIPAHG